MLILVCTNIQKDFLLTSNNYLCYLIRRLWGAPWPVLNLLNLLGAHCPYLPEGQSKLGLKLGRKKRGFSTYHHLLEQGQAWRILTNETNKRGWCQLSGPGEFFLHKIRVCHLLSWVSGHIHPIGSPFNHSLYSLECLRILWWGQAQIIHLNKRNERGNGFKTLQTVYLKLIICWYCKTKNVVHHLVLQKLSHQPCSHWLQYTLEGIQDEGRDETLCALGKQAKQALS